MASLIKRVNGWTAGQATGGANGLALIVDCVDHIFAHSDWTPAAWLLSKAQDTDRTRIRQIMGEIMGGVTVKTDKKQPSGYRFVLGDNAGVTDKMTLARECVEQRLSFRSKMLAECGLLEKKESAEFDKEKYAKSVAKKLKANGVGVEVLDLIRAELVSASLEPDH